MSLKLIHYKLINLNHSFLIQYFKLFYLFLYLWIKMLLIFS